MPVDTQIPDTVKIPQQARSREKFYAMLAAAETLFAEQGIPQTSVAQIVEAAGVSIGAFYQRFENKDALIHTIFFLLENEIDAMGEQLEPNKDRSIEVTVTNFVGAFTDVYDRKRGVLLSLLLAVQENSNIRDYVFRLREKVSRTFEQALLPHKADIGAKRFKKATAMSMRLLNSYLDQYMIWEGHQPTESALKFKTSNTELVDVLCRYLRQ